MGVNSRGPQTHMYVHPHTLVDTGFKVLNDLTRLLDGLQALFTC